MSMVGNIICQMIARENNHTHTVHLQGEQFRWFFVEYAAGTG